MNLFEIQVAGRFEIYSDKRGLLAEFDNMILDQGLEFLAINGLPPFIWLGRGTTPPVETNTALEIFAGRSGTASPRILTEVTGSSVPPYYVQQRLGVRFNAGTVTGNIAEIGIGNTSILVSRALIKNSSGVPIVLTILPDEIIDVAYYYRVYAYTTEASGSLAFEGNIGGTYNFISRACLVTTFGSSGWWPNNAFNYTSNGWSAAFSGSIGTVTQQPSGSQAQISTSVDAYVANSRQIKFWARMSTTQNITGGIVKSIAMNVGPTKFQMEFTPGIPKTNLDTLDLQFSYSFGRYTP